MTLDIKIEKENMVFLLISHKIAVITEVALLLESFLYIDTYLKFKPIS
jgi:hypothetical protein